MTSRFVEGVTFPEIVNAAIEDVGHESIWVELEHPRTAFLRLVDIDAEDLEEPWMYDQPVCSWHPSVLRNREDLVWPVPVTILGTISITRGPCLRVVQLGADRPVLKGFTRLDDGRWQWVIGECDRETTYRSISGCRGLEAQEDSDGPWTTILPPDETELPSDARALRVAVAHTFCERHEPLSLRSHRGDEVECHCSECEMAAFCDFRTCQCPDAEHCQYAAQGRAS